MITGQYTTPLLTSRLYAIHHTILVITISRKGQSVRDVTSTSGESGPFSFFPFFKGALYA